MGNKRLTWKIKGLTWKIKASPFVSYGLALVCELDRGPPCVEQLNAPCPGGHPCYTGALLWEGLGWPSLYSSAWFSAGFTTIRYWQYKHT